MSVLHRSIELLEPYDGKLSCTVLRGGKAPVRVLTYPIFCFIFIWLMSYCR